MIIYKVYETDFERDLYGHTFGEAEVKYYISRDLADKDFNNRLNEWPSCPVKLEVITTED